MRIYNAILFKLCERTGKKCKILIVATLWGQFSDLILRRLLFYFLIRVLALRSVYPVKTFYMLMIPVFLKCIIYLNKNVLKILIHTCKYLMHIHLITSFSSVRIPLNNLTQPNAQLFGQLGFEQDSNSMISTVLTPVNSKTRRLLTLTSTLL